MYVNAKTQDLDSIIGGQNSGKCSPIKGYVLICYLWHYKSPAPVYF